MRQYVVLHRLERHITKRMAQHSPLPRMLTTINRAVCAIRILRRRERRVEIRFPYIPLEAVDVVQSGACVERYAIWTKANNVAVFLMAPPEFEMSVAFPGVVGGVEICDFRPEGSRVFGERMEVEAVDDEANEICGEDYEW